MKIAYDAKRFFNNNSGLGNYSRDLIRILSKFYPENQYLLLNKSKSLRGQEILERPNVVYVETSKAKFSRQLQIGIAAQELGADIFHGLSGELPLRWNSAHKISKIVTIHDLIFERYPEYYSWLDRKIHFWKFRKAAGSADLIIAISEQTKHDIITYLKISPKKIRVAYQGCHQAFKQHFSSEFLQNISEKYQLPKKFVLSVGTVESRKNLLNVVKSLANSDVPLVVVGRRQKKYGKKIEKVLKKDGVKIQFLDGVSMEELAAVYRLATVFVYASFFEGFGIPVIEALFSGTPVVASNRSSIPEAGGCAALYVDSNDPADIRAKILHLWNSDAERGRRAEIGKIFVQKFSDEAVARSLIEVYEEVLKIKNPE